MRKSISDENREMLTALLDNIYGNWLEKVALTKGDFRFELHTGDLKSSGDFHDLFSYSGKKIEDIEQFVNDGVYQVERLKEESWITDIKYDDEV